MVRVSIQGSGFRVESSGLRVQALLAASYCLDSAASVSRLWVTSVFVFCMGPEPYLLKGNILGFD